MKSLLRSITAVIALTGIFGTALAAPAKADTATTDGTILAILGGIGAAVATSVVQGHTQGGATVYADGHVVEQNGTTWYPRDSGMTISCLNGTCTFIGLAQPAQLATDYGGQAWVPFLLPDGNTGEFANVGNGTYYYFGPDGALYLDNYPGEVQPQDVATNSLGNVATYQFP